MYQISPNFILREIGDEAIVVPVGNAGDLENSMISLNETYAFIWKQFIEPNTLERAIECVKEEYDAPEGIIEQHVTDSVKELIIRGMLVEV